MTDTIIRQVSFPTDEDGFFRRECPYCKNEFKIVSDEAEEQTEFYCPYCGQQAPEDHWWTQEQADYRNTIAKNFAIDSINENLIRPLKRTTSRSDMVRIETKELDKQREIIRPERNDMQIVDLPCCNKKIKIEENWEKQVFCFYCGFPHRH